MNLKFSYLSTDTQEQYLSFFLITFIILSFARKEIQYSFSILRGSIPILHMTWPELQCNFSPHPRQGRDSQILQQQLQVSSVLTGIKSNIRTHQCSQTKSPSTLLAAAGSGADRKDKTSGVSFNFLSYNLTLPGIVKKEEPF